MNGSNSSNTSGTAPVALPSGSQAMLITSLVLGIISLIGLTGNGLAVVISRRLRSHRTHASVLAFIFHLALSDLLVCGVCIPLTISANFIYMDSSSSSSQAACKVLRFLQFLAPTLSITILTTVSIDRYFALVKPLVESNFVRRPARMVTIAWLYSIVLFLPTFYFVEVIDISVGNIMFGYCTTVPYNTRLGFGFLMFIAITTFVLPLAIMFLMYFGIVRVVWFRKRTLTGANSSISGDKIFKRSKKKVLKLFFVVILVFLICWLPFVVYCGFIEMYVAKFPNPADMVRIITYFLGLSNSLCNPFVYFFSNNEFRNACVDLLCCREMRISQSALYTSSPYSSPALRNRHSSMSNTLGRASISGSPNFARTRFLTVSSLDSPLLGGSPIQGLPRKRRSKGDVSNLNKEIFRSSSTSSPNINRERQSTLANGNHRTKRVTHFNDSTVLQSSLHSGTKNITERVLRQNEPQRLSWSRIEQNHIKEEGEKESSNIISKLNQDNSGQNKYEAARNLGSIGNRSLTQTRRIKQSPQDIAKSRGRSETLGDFRVKKPLTKAPTQIHFNVSSDKTPATSQFDSTFNKGLSADEIHLGDTGGITPAAVSLLKPQYTSSV